MANMAMTLARRMRGQDTSAMDRRVWEASRLPHLRHPDGRPIRRLIARELGISRETVKRALVRIAANGGDPTPPLPSYHLGDRRREMAEDRLGWALSLARDWVRRKGLDGDRAQMIRDAAVDGLLRAARLSRTEDGRLSGELVKLCVRSAILDAVKSAGFRRPACEPLAAWDVADTHDHVADIVVRDEIETLRRWGLLPGDEAQAAGRCAYELTKGGAA